jgi:magnesium transporter
MLLFKKKRKAPVGARPGTLARSDDAEPTLVRTVRFDENGVTDEVLADGPLPSPSDDDKLWLDVRGLRDLEMLQRIGESFSMHALALEDVVNVPQRPKAEIYEADSSAAQYLCIFRVVSLTDQGELATEQLSVVLGRRFVLTFQEGHDDSLKPIRKRLRSPQARLRRFGPDYLAYALLDTVIDGYYPVLERIAEQLEALEDSIIENPSPELLRKLQRHKRNLLLLRRAVWPEREALALILREPSNLFTKETLVFLRDVYDHIVQVADVIESYRDMVGELTNTYLSVSSNKMNEVMKVLTIMASIFIPLTFMAGIYGMNFEVIPELSVPWAYPALLLGMLLIALLMLLFFWRKGWIGKGPRGG